MGNSDEKKYPDLLLIGGPKWRESLRGLIANEWPQLNVKQADHSQELTLKSDFEGLAILLDTLPHYDSTLALDALNRTGSGRTIICGVADAQRASRLCDLGAHVLLCSPIDDALLPNLRIQLSRWFQQTARLEHRFQDLIDASEYVGEGIEITDERGEILYVNKAFENLSGYSKAEAVGKRASELFSNDLSPPLVYDQIWETVQSPEVWRGRLISKKADETLFHQAATISPVLDSNDKLRYAVVIRRDITAQVRSEGALKISEERYRLLAENATDIIWTAGLDGWITYCSPSIRRVLGYSVEEALDWSIEDVLPLQSLGTLFDTVSNPHHSATETEGLKLPQIFEVAQSRKDGKILWCEVLVDFLRGRDGQIDGLLGVSRDITARREVEHDRASLKAQLQQSQKMEAIGRMAGGISHDFNNLLTSILVSAQLLLKEETQGGTFRRDILEIKEAADRATDLTKQLLAFSRNQVIAPKVLNVNATLKASLRMVERLIHEDIHFEFKPATETPLTTSLDPIQLEQVLVNLVVNSRDAMPDGGKIIVETELKSLSESQCRPILGLKPGNYISLLVTDSGHGMNEATKARLFEPFFTTKPPGKGTGLGLSTVYGIVKQNNGFIDVQSRVGRGTSVEIFFPQVEQKPRVLPLQEEKPIEKTHGQRVLIVEDQPMVRNVARRILERNGFEVLEATNGREALALGEDKKEKPDLLLTDVVMPEVGGRVLADSLRERHPSLRVLFMSGYTEDHLETTDLEAPLTGFIQKPFTVNGLLGAVQELLNQPSAS